MFVPVLSASLKCEGCGGGREGPRFIFKFDHKSNGRYERVGRC